MERKWVGLIIIILGAILLAVIVYFLFFFDFNRPQPAVNNPVAAPASNIPAQITPVVPEKKVVAAPPLNPEQVTQEDVKRLARLFAERYGSYSNQSNYQNMEDLKIFMTEKMKAWTDDFIHQAIAKKTDNSIYYGITTKAVSTSMQKFDDEDGQAKVLIGTQRREATGTTNNTSNLQQSIEITLIKEGGAWKVDDAVWQGD